MSTSPTRTRWVIPEPRGSFKSFLEKLRGPYVWTRVVVCALAIIALWAICRGWEPAFAYRVRLAPLHSLQARVPFDIVDISGTEEAKRMARNSALCYYRHSPTLLQNLRLALRDRVFELRSQEFADPQVKIWEEFFLAGAANVEGLEPTAETFERFRKALDGDERLSALDRALEEAFSEVERIGLLASLNHEFGDGNMERIMVTSDSSEKSVEVAVSDVRIDEIRAVLHRRITDAVQKQSTFISDDQFVADRLFHWLSPHLPTTLTWDRALTRLKTDQMIREMPPVYKRFQTGDVLETPDPSGAADRDRIGGKPLTVGEIQLLKAEHEAFVGARTIWARLAYSLAFVGMLTAALSLLVAYLNHRERPLLQNVWRFARLIALFVVTLATAWFLVRDVESRAEMVPVVMLAILIAIALEVELAILLGGLVSLVFSIAHGYGLGEFVLLGGATCTASLMCRSIRSRTRLIYVGFAVAAVAGPTALGVNYMRGQPLTTALLFEAAWFCGCGMLAALFMTALLPFLERRFEILTDIRMLELGDANHPLLRELVQRAPGTYNHSISVASIAEAAAEVVHANGLLCRVGSYFHDIGKMRKPEYFVENQLGRENKHADLVPTMSTLVIIAHVKDGAEMARQHRLPRRVIDIIEQHHGTTLVEYFYNEAARRAGEDTEPEESTFRYPGPKPQSPEAAIVMLADAAESASRALRDPGPARLESLVESIVLKRVTAGQLDDCSLTMAQLRDVQDSLIKSLNAMYHARVKYPESTQPA